MSSSASATVRDKGATRAPWKAEVARYARPTLSRTLLDIATSVLPYVILMVASYLLLGVSVLLSLALAPLAAGFLVRTFILFHD
jgi:omega-6 fatty acid desaturase (delta-12 desaturase)